MNTSVQDKALFESQMQEPQISDFQASDHPELAAALTLQRAAFRKHGQESYQQRREHLTNLKRLLLENREQIVEAINKDYGNRSYHETMIAEIITVADDIDHTLKSLKKWMKVQRRKIDFMLYPGAKNRVIPQAVGVVGLIIPWNFPLNLSFSGLSAAFAAGNRAMVKMSENSIHLSELLIQLAPNYFPADKLQFFTETGSVGIAFSKLPFDHLMFTGSGQTGRKVMAAAAEHLTPVTLELGGKSPAVIDPEYPLRKAVERLMFVKQFNAGQICTTVDYVFVHEQQLNAFIAEVQRWVNHHCANIHSRDYTSVIDDRAFQRLLETLDDAREKGAEVINLTGQEPDAATRKLPLTLVLNSTDEMIIDQRETFGPILMVKTYTDPQQVIDYVNDRDRPLALYPFSYNKPLVNRYISNILSGGVSVNDALFHVGQHDLPFGGIGGSGMGHYHGYEGFLTFSKLRPVFYQAPFSGMKFLMPPYGKTADRMLGLIAKLKL
ncbi:coniferyl aldehyde dehydrogenase [Marinomonas fungiae]|uniref:Aldehyde dehydrogenase n=1 Tax=Marinomonas fungiae TaxID=1137284 RepID=A0A0K6IUI6_9GAMM|nr:coniferyl aldehyde dehydrogenase [Marinomonas fungiae]CUB06776.1 Acyl-CoA reductase or other NAD-dependent aldehyde dehydrogenase [Marinomonas fungiae]